MYAVIMAGGGGTRLWPLSRPDRPKPFLPLLGDETLLQRSARRLAPLVGPEDVYVVTDRRYLPLVAEQLPGVPAANLIGEPMGRNTAAAVALAAEAIDRPDDDVMLILPADHQIVDEEGFRRALAVAGEVARDGRLMTLGVTPTGPETGYGYVLATGSARQVDGMDTYRVERFVEKPTVERAAELIATGLASWNAGIFVWTRRAIRDRLNRHAPDIAGAIAGAHAAAALDDVYATLRATSIDYAVMEPASLEGAVGVVPIDVGWSDLGSWSAMRDAWAAEAGAGGAGAYAGGAAAGVGGVVGTGNRRDVGSVGTLVLAGDRLVVTVGLEGIIVVDTPDALLVCAADRSQDVRGVAEALAREQAARTAAAANPAAEPAAAGKEEA